MPADTDLKHSGIREVELKRVGRPRSGLAARSLLRPQTPPRPQLRVVERRQRFVRLHLFTYILGNAFFWGLWGAISVSAHPWYWWPVLPSLGWTVVLTLHLWHAGR